MKMLQQGLGGSRVFFFFLLSASCVVSIMMNIGIPVFATMAGRCVLVAGHSSLGRTPSSTQQNHYFRFTVGLHFRAAAAAITIL